MDSVRSQSRRPRTKNDLLISGGVYEHRIDSDGLNRLVELFRKSVPRSTRSLLFDLLTKKELADISRRIIIAEMILNGLTYDEIGKRLDCSRNTIATIATSLNRPDSILTKLLNPELSVGGPENYFANRLKKGK
ncbi:MAG: helix-turn-helix domain-containing protein [Patescibacteria group bacterium]|jgi:uncharacterized protein YerC